MQRKPDPFRSHSAGSENMIEVLFRPIRFFDRLATREPKKVVPGLILAATVGLIGYSAEPLFAVEDVSRVITVMLAVSLFGGFFSVALLIGIWIPIRFACGKGARCFEIVGYSQMPTLVGVSCVLLLEQLAPSALGELKGGGFGYSMGSLPATLSATIGALELSEVWSLPLLLFGVRSLAPGSEYSALVALTCVAVVPTVLLASF